MPLAHSKVTARGQTSIPAEIRRKLGIEPGSTLEWDEFGDHIVVRRAGRFTSVDIHQAAFPDGTPEARTLGDLETGLRRHARDRHARR